MKKLAIGIGFVVFGLCLVNGMIETATTISGVEKNFTKEEVE